MGKSERVRAADEVRVLRFVGECVELGDDAVAWQLRLVDGLRSLTGGLIAVGGPTPPTPSGTAASVQDWGVRDVSDGWPSPVVRARWEALLADPSAIGRHPGVAGFWSRPEPDLVLTRKEIVDDAGWERSGFVNDTLRADGMDEGLMGRTTVPLVGGGYMLTVVRAEGERPFARRAGLVTAALLRELRPHLGRSLLLTTQPNLHGLSPRRRQVLECLLDGDSEKLVALRLSLHPTTIHDHVKRLYRHFGVNTRAELMAHFLRRQRRPE